MSTNSEQSVESNREAEADPAKVWREWAIGLVGEWTDRPTTDDDLRERVGRCVDECGKWEIWASRVTGVPLGIENDETLRTRPVGHGERVVFASIFVDHLDHLHVRMLQGRTGDVRGLEFHDRLRTRVWPECDGVGKVVIDERVGRQFAGDIPRALRWLVTGKDEDRP